MKFSLSILALVTLLTATNACTPNGSGTSAANDKPAKSSAELSKLQHATFAGGCFWCEEAVFESIIGVEEVVSGYSGGRTSNPTYEEVGGGRTGHAEAIEVFYDSTKVSYFDLLSVFKASIDPYQVNGQGPDHGSQYRSIIFYRNPVEKLKAQELLRDMENEAKGRTVGVELLPFEKFWDAEDYHQDYVPHHPENPYVQGESIPRVKRTQARVLELVKPDRKL
jgi:peptide-methionine (S)-S-oxide reductase